jgi:ABC-2 type transport system permease protein
MVLSNLSSRRAADQIFPFIMLPQYFLAGVFNQVRVLPWYLDVLSKLSPMRYAVDLVRGAFYAGRPDYEAVVLLPLPVNAALIATAFTVFLVIGTFLFVRSERNR